LSNTPNRDFFPQTKPSPLILVHSGLWKLTKYGKRIILKAMKRKLLAGTVFVLLTLSVFLSRSQETRPPEQTNPPPESVPAPPEEYPAKQPKYDYMSSFFSRNTKPLGLKEDQALKKLLRQRGIIWAVRTQVRHILD